MQELFMLCQELFQTKSRVPIVKVSTDGKKIIEAINGHSRMYFFISRENDGEFKVIYTTTDSLKAKQSIIVNADAVQLSHDTTLDDLPEMQRHLRQATVIPAAQHFGIFEGGQLVEYIYFKHMNLHRDGSFPGGLELYAVRGRANPLQQRLRLYKRTRWYDTAQLMELINRGEVVPLTNYIAALRQFRELRIRYQKVLQLDDTYLATAQTWSTLRPGEERSSSASVIDLRKG